MRTGFCNVLCKRGRVNSFGVKSYEDDEELIEDTFIGKTEDNDKGWLSIEKIRKNLTIVRNLFLLQW